MSENQNVRSVTIFDQQAVGAVYIKFAGSARLESFYVNKNPWTSGIDRDYLFTWSTPTADERQKVEETRAGFVEFLFLHGDMKQPLAFNWSNIDALWWSGKQPRQANLNAQEALVVYLGGMRGNVGIPLAMAAEDIGTTEIAIEGRAKRATDYIKFSGGLLYLTDAGVEWSDEYKACTTS